MCLATLTLLLPDLRGLAPSDVTHAVQNVFARLIILHNINYANNDVMMFERLVRSNNANTSIQASPFKRQPLVP